MTDHELWHERRRRLRSVGFETAEDADGAKRFSWSVGDRRLEIVVGCPEGQGLIQATRHEAGNIAKERGIDPRDIWAVAEDFGWIGEGYKEVPE